MQEPQKQENKLGILEVAKKKRHIALLEKPHSGKPPSRKELEELEEYEDGKPNPGIIKTQEELAKIFGISPRTVRYWEKEGLPKTRQGYFNISDVQEWRNNHDKRRVKKQKEEDKDEAKYRKFKALLAELEYKRKTKQLVPVAEVEKNNIDKILTIKTRLLALPNAVAPQVVGLEAKEISEILRKRIEEIIDEFASGKPIHTKKKGK